MSTARNTAGYSAGRVCYPSAASARAGFRRAVRAHRAGLTEDAPRAPWSPALPSTGERCPLLALVAPTPTRRDYTLAAGGAR